LNRNQEIAFRGFDTSFDKLILRQAQDYSDTDLLTTDLPLTDSPTTDLPTTDLLIMTRILPTSAPEALQTALDLLRAGEVIAFPTDTVYGVGALAFDTNAAREIYRVKQRPPEKALPILLGDFSQVQQVAAEVTPLARKLAAAFLPGALTIILPKHPKLPREVSALDTVGVRVPDHAFARALLRAAGAMAVSSANLSGAANPVDAGEVYAQLKGSLPLILDGGRTRGSVPSTVVDCCGSKPVILREGPISADEIQALLAEKG